LANENDQQDRLEMRIDLSGSSSHLGRYDPGHGGNRLLPNRDTCWERIYDDAHLKAHPRQQVVQIRLFHLPSRWPRPASGETFVALEKNLRARTHGSDAFDYSLGWFCQPSRGGLRCEPDWHAGSWQIERGANGSCATMTSPSIRPHLPRRSGRKML
jgi:hypothetical protein